LSSAARELGLTPAAVSKHLRKWRLVPASRS
jgi:DNA-binding transcriptional LysR family regulator